MQTFKKIAEASWFSNFIIGTIVVAGLLVGLETYPSLEADFGGIFHVLDQVILWIFVAEVVIKMAAEGTKPWRYFMDPWNIFDFAIVAVCFMPFDAKFVAVLRLARILRVLKLVTAIPQLQILVSALLKSIPSMGYVSLLLFLHFYIYAAIAVTMFSGNDPIHFGNLQISMLSLFRAVTLEDWTDLMYIQMYGCANYGYGGSEALCTASNAMPVFGALYFVSFILLGTMIIMNLFIGVIMGGMDDARSDEDNRKRADRKKELATINEHFDEVSEKLIALQKELSTLKVRVHTEDGPSDKKKAA